MRVCVYDVCVCVRGLMGQRRLRRVEQKVRICDSVTRTKCHHRAIVHSYDSVQLVGSPALRRDCTDTSSVKTN